MRTQLRDGLANNGYRNWQHITDQIGMFAHTGMTPEQVGAITKDFTVYHQGWPYLPCRHFHENVGYLAEASTL